ncbi:hypothetical protein AGLY_017732 [Aphis glycines]|uniref:Uncharacterized protein n=1 Tax=Aphis glycines TaxID=307491 RepID=A0A6G0STY2_APHGL|nr:hypothetical protein AGLY_017732 [Aphis glycines]
MKTSIILRHGSIIDSYTASYFTIPAIPHHELKKFKRHITVHYNIICPFENLYMQLNIIIEIQNVVIQLLNKRIALTGNFLKYYESIFTALRFIRSSPSIDVNRFLKCIGLESKRFQEQKMVGLRWLSEPSKPPYLRPCHHNNNDNMITVHIGLHPSTHLTQGWPTRYEFKAQNLKAFKKLYKTSMYIIKSLRYYRWQMSKKYTALRNNKKYTINNQKQPGTSVYLLKASRRPDKYWNFLLASQLYYNIFKSTKKYMHKLYTISNPEFISQAIHLNNKLNRNVIKLNCTKIVCHPRLLLFGTEYEYHILQTVLFFNENEIISKYVIFIMIKSYAANDIKLTETITIVFCISSHLKKHKILKYT